MWNLRAALAWHRKGKNISLQSQFLLGLAAIFLCFCLLATTLIYLYEKKALEEDVYHKTELIMAAVESTRGYIKEVLRPRMYELYGEKTFVLEAMSTSYISRVVMDRFQKRLPDFEYRRVAINAFNPDYEANGLELKMIRYFTEHPSKKDWHGIIKKGASHVYTRFRPVSFQASCLHCHGNPADAPQAVIALYGRERGFHQPRDKVRGVISVSVPVDVGMVAIMEVAWKVFSVTLFAVFFLYVIIWLFFNNLIIGDLRGILEIFRDNLRDEHGAQLYEQARSKDEFGELSAAVQVVAEHLRMSRQKLEDYAQNLEKKVAERTLALQQSKQILHEKVITRGQELRVMNTITELITKSVHLADILPKVLQQALHVIPAQGAGIYLLDRNRARLVLQCQTNAPGLEEKIPFDASQCLPMLDKEQLDFDGFIQEAACSHFSMFGNEPALMKNLNVPLCCRNQILGVMTFVGDGLQDVDAQLHELLFSIGHQIGITIESLQNMLGLIHGKELLQTVFDGITDVVMLLDHKNRVKMVNQAFLDRHGVSMTEVLDCSLDMLPTNIPCPFSSCKTGVSFTGRQPVIEQVQVEGCIYEVSFYPIFSEEGQVRNIVCYAKDITKQREIERRIQQTEKLVALGQLAAGVAHEINNPLGVILCYTEILKEDGQAGAEQRYEDIKIIEKHARSCQRIVTDLLNFSRSHQTIKREAAINPIIENVVSMVNQQFRKKMIALEMDLAPDLPHLLLDEGRMKQVFLNLLMNALHAGRENGTVRITSRLLAAEQRVAVEVEDDGQGIEPQVLPKIFDPFFTTKPQGTGTGLGLSVSYGIIRDHDGDIRVESEPGAWTRFTIVLPQQPENQGTRHA